VTTEKPPAALPKISKIPLILMVLLLAAYIFVVLVPAFAKAGAVPADVFSLIWPPALIVFGFGFFMWGRFLLAKKATETK
jgi:uncharacterized RDD family membrane protein YckC